MSQPTITYLRKAFILKPINFCRQKPKDFDNSENYLKKMRPVFSYEALCHF